MSGIAGVGLRMSFGGVEVVKGVDIELRPGEVNAIIGENGAGKSTVAKLLAGVYRPTGGSIAVGGSEVVLQSPRHAISRGIALIHQEPLTFPDLDVAENIFVGHQPSSRFGLDWRRMRTQAQAILDSLGVKLDPRAKVGGLSVADQQMVELAAALSHDAKVFLFDETTASLTPKEVEELFVIIRRLREQRCAIAFVSHRLDEVLAISDRITVMRDGDKVGELTPASTSVDEIVRLMVGRALATSEPRTMHGDGDVALEVRGLTVPGRVKSVSFQISSGEIVGLAGLVGAGRTDVARAIFGIAKPSSGTLLVSGKEVRINNPRQAMKLGLALVPEDRQHEGLLMPMSITRNATLAILRQLATAGWVRDRAANDLTEREADKLQLVRRSTDQTVAELSGGNQQKVVLAKWLVTKPSILILDEPTRGVDVGAKAEVHRLIRELAAQGLAVLMISSDLSEVLEMSDRILVMREGRLAGELPRGAPAEAVMQAAATG
ncbi:MAG: sugar ABC transporter ATP-binding protein [Fimbriimonas sp.]